MIPLLLALVQQTPATAPAATAPATAPVVQASPAPLPPPAPGIARVAITTTEGRIVLDLEQARAPVTTRNFLRYVGEHRLDGVAFYRAVKVQPHFGFVQFGTQNAPARTLPPIVHEPSTQTGVTHTSGAISMARLAPGSARGDFTINIGDQPSLDAGSGNPADNLGYAAFGHVVEGLDVVERIMDAPTRGGPPFPGENLVTPVRIVAARRVDTKAGSGGTLPF